MKPSRATRLTLFGFALLLLAPSPAARSERAPLYLDAGLPPDVRVEDLLPRLTVEEKVRMLGGTGFTTQPVERLGIPAFRMSDASVGSRNDGPTTAYPASVALAAAFNADLAVRVGTALGHDARARGVHILLGPGVDLYRAPFGGRNFEYLGEDPVLAGQTAAGFIRGLQGQGVAATIKHYAANDQEFDRHRLSSDLDERTLRELSVRQFEIAVREGGPKAVMTSYNPVNGVPMSQNSALVNGVLKGEWNFRGLVMSDWDSCYDTLGMMLGGLDLEMPNPQFYRPELVQRLLDSGRVPTAVLDEKIRRQLRVGFELGWFDRPQADPGIPRDDPASAAVALAAAREGIVLLKNDGAVLPLDPARVRRLAVLGANADHPITGGGGSSFATPFPGHALSVVDALRQQAATPDAVAFVPAWAADAEAPAAVREADAVIVCVGFDTPGVNAPNRGALGEHEGGDRQYALPPGQEELIRAAAAANPRVIVVLNAGGSVATEGWIDRTAGLLHLFYPGQEGTKALAEIVFGRTNPSGRLPFTWEKRWEDAAAYGHYPSKETPRSNDYAEGLLLGYRWFDARGLEPRFPFGFGLGYTQFELTDLTALAAGVGETTTVKVQGHPVRREDRAKSVELTVQVRNTGPVPGAEVVQVYVETPPVATSPAPRPPRELKAFAKVFLQPGETRTVTLSIPAADLAVWDVTGHAWTLPRGRHVFLAGEHSRRLPLRAGLEL